MCTRRLDVAVIALLLALAFILNFVSAMVPNLRALLFPRFGFSLNLAAFPVVHLCMYLWRPSIRNLWAAVGMILFIAIMGAVATWSLGTVDEITGQSSKLLRSAYLFQRYRRWLSLHTLHASRGDCERLGRCFQPLRSKS